MKLREELQSRVETLKSELERVRKRAAEAKSEEETLSNDLAAYQRILDAEGRRNGNQSHSASAVSSDSTPKPFFVLDAPQADEDVNKAELMREAILQNQMSGSTAVSVQDALKRKGVDCPLTYIYGAISRMKAKGLVVKRRKKWFPSESLINLGTTKQTASESA